MKKVAFLPFRNTENEYTVIMRNIIRKQAELVDYVLVRRGLIPYQTVDTFYLNWVENSWTEEDERLLKKAKRAKKKIIWVFHNRVPHETKNYENAVRIIKLLVDLSDVIIIHSKSSVQYLNMYSSCASAKAVYIPVTSYENIYQNYGGNIREKYGISNQDIVFGLYGLIRPYKNIEVLMKIFCSNEFSNVKLLVVGKCNDYNYFKELKKNKSKNIIFENKYINNLEMGSYLEATDALILPYNIQSSMNSGAMIMAFSYGKTVVVPQIAMSDEFPDDLVFKYDYESNESMERALYAMIQEVISVSKAELAARGEKLKRIIQKNNSLDLVEKILLSII